MNFKAGDFVEVINLDPADEGIKLGMRGHVVFRCTCMSGSINTLFGMPTYKVHFSELAVDPCVYYWQIKKVDGYDESRKLVRWETSPWSPTKKEKALC